MFEKQLETEAEASIGHLADHHACCMRRFHTGSRASPRRPSVSGLTLKGFRGSRHLRGAYRLLGFTLDLS